MNRLHLITATFAVALIAAFANAVSAQGVLVDVHVDRHIRLPRPFPIPPRPIPQSPPSSYKIDAIEVNAKLNDQIARVQVSQEFENTGSSQMEVSFLFPLPYDGAIDQLTLLIDGKETQAKLLSKEEARKRYEEIVRKNRDPALLEWVGTGMFQTSVFPIPAGAKRTVTLRYSQLLRKNYGLTDFIFPLSTAKYTSEPVGKVSVQLSIESSTPIKNIYSATHSVNIEWPDKTHALVKYEAKKTIPGEDFRLFFDSGDESVAASVVSYRPKTDDDGYFLMLASPDVKAADSKPIPKTVVFVVDRSGSMSGEKIEQAKNAAKFVLNNLREGDLFNIIAYDSEISTFRPELQKFDKDTRASAAGFIDGLYAGGSTDINGALKRALGMLADNKRPTYVLFLTDGLPTSGETGESAIVKHSEEANRVRARVFAFGVGYDVNSRLLDKLARTNFGLSQYVRPNEDIEATVSALYRKIGAPVMTNIAVTVDVDSNSNGAPPVNRIYPKGELDLFAGDQVVLVGRYHSSGNAKVKLKGKIGDDEKSFDFPADLVKKSDDDTNAFVAKLWATRRVGEIIDEIDLKGRNEELVKELVALATEHGILTPYTSFLATEGNEELRDVAANRARAFGEVDALAQTTGKHAFAQRGAKLSLQTASQTPAAIASGPGGSAAGEAEVQLQRSAGGFFGGNAWYYDAKEDKSAVAANCRQLGRKTFFERSGRLVDSTVTEAQEKSAKKIERYSQEYFNLIERHGKHVAQYLALDDPVCINLGGETYEW